MSRGDPYLSVIVPVRGGARLLPDTLGAMLESDLSKDRWELIVVDDASDDDTAAVAARYADVVIRLSGKPRGPAYARNRGFEVSRGAVIVFIDADVRVHGDTLSRFARAFEEGADVSAVFGSYDASPAAPGLVSQYRNLLHHFVHQANPGDAETFWAGCGAVRSAAFAEVGMYDEWHFSQPQIEDIELGRRLRRAGHRIVLRPDIQGTHLKQWSLRDVLRTDLRSRGVPWTRLLMQEGSAAGFTLNVGAAQRACTVGVGLALLSLIAAAVTTNLVLLLAAIGLLAGVLAVNWRFYDLLRRQRGLLFAIAVAPLHLAYYTSNGVAVVLGSLAHAVVGPPQPPVDVAAYSEIGLEEWPPVPARPKKSTWYPHG